MKVCLFVLREAVVQDETIGPTLRYADLRQTPVLW